MNINKPDSRQATLIAEAAFSSANLTPLAKKLMFELAICKQS